MKTVLVFFVIVLACLSLPSIAVEGIPDPKEPCPIRLSASGAIIVTAARTKAWIPPDSTLCFAPLSALPNYKPTAIYLNIDGVGEELPDMASVAMPLVSVSGLAPGQRAVRARRAVRFTVADRSGNVIEAMQCAVENRDPGVLTSMSTVWRDERIKATIQRRAALGGVYFFTDAGYVGRLDEAADCASIDCRKLPSGSHTLWAVPETSDGILLPPLKSELSVAPRFTFSCDGDKTSYLVTQEAPDAKMNMKVVRAAGVDTMKTWIYLAGDLVGESDKPEFDMAIPLKDVPSGMQEIEVVGVGKDGTRYAAEVAKINIENQPWNAYIVGTIEYRTIQANKAAINKFEEDANYWLARAQAEPGFSSFNRTRQTRSFTSQYGTTLNTDYFDTLIASGKAAEDIGNAKRALIQMAQLLLHDGALYKRIKMKAAARTYFRRAYYVAGSNSVTGRSAKNALDEMEDSK